MVLVKEVNLSLFPQFCPLLQEIHSQLSEQEWYSVFAHQWHSERKPCGYGLFDDTKIVGCLGFIFSQRMINGQLEDFCNLTSWIVQEPYRGQDISLVPALRKLKNCTIIDLSPTEGVVGIFQRLGFQELDTQIEILPHVLAGISSNKIKIIQGISAIKPKLKPAEQNLLSDHQPYSRCQHLLIEAAGEQCYLIFTLVKNTKFPYSYIQYLSKSPLFARYSLAIRQAIAKTNQIWLVLVDRRLVQGAKLP